MKARGGLAVMGTSRHMRVARPRLQDLLWSDRGADQGADSLRQMLREIRQALGPFRDALLSGPGWVGLCESEVTVVLFPPPGSPPTEFAADLDINDPEFEDWLRDMRAMIAARSEQVAAPAAQATGLADLIILTPESTDSQAGVAAAMIIQEAAARAADLLPLNVLDRLAPGNRPAIELGAIAMRESHNTAIMVVIKDPYSRRMIWTRRFMLGPDAFGQGVREAVGQLTLAILRMAEAVPGLATGHHLPVTDVFSFSGARLLGADRAMVQLEGLADGPVLLAMRAYLRNTLLLERLTPDPRTTLLEAEEMSARAIEASPGSSPVLAVAALIAARQRKAAYAHELAQQAVNADSENALARLALSQSLTDLGEHTRAAIEAKRAHQGALSGLGPATWLMRRCITAVYSGNLNEAISHAAAAHEFSPENRPALRFLAALHFKQKNEAAARDALLRLKHLEPDFTLDLMGREEYPLATLRACNLLGVTKSELL